VAEELGDDHEVGAAAHERGREGVPEAATRSEPYVCLRSWNLKGSSPAASRPRSKRRRSADGSRRRPKRLQKT